VDAHHRRRNSRSALAALAALAAVAAPLAGCGSSSSSSSSATPTAAASSSHGGSAASSPILIGTELPLTGQFVTFPDSQAGLEAAVASVNATGGINGHPLRLTVCDTDFDPNKELSCTRQLLGDKVVAIVGPIISADESGREFELADQANVPVIDGEAAVPSEFKYANVFPTTSGFVGWVYGTVKNLISSGSSKIAVISLNNAAGAYGAILAGQALAHFGLKAAASVPADPQTDPSFATAAAKAVSSGANGLVLSMLPAQIPPLLTAIRNAGYRGRVATFSQLATPALLKAAGSAANGLLVTAHAAFLTDTSNTGVSSFLAEMKQYQPNPAYLTENAIVDWSTVKLFAKVMAAASAGRDAPTAAQALSAFKGVTSPVELGSVGPFGPPPSTPYVAGYARMTAPWVTDGVVQHGAVEANGKGYVNPFTK
jgi:branched-chain amino acid transport system substrate-binding protein